MEQSIWLIIKGSLVLVHLRASQTVTGHGKAAVVAVWALCAGFGADGGGAPVEGIWTALGRVWGGSCLEQLRRGNPDHLGHSISKKECLRGAPFRALWGRSILVLG